MAQTAESEQGEFFTFEQILETFSEDVENLYPLPPKKEILPFANNPLFDLNFSMQFTMARHYSPIEIKENIIGWRQEYKEVSWEEQLEFNYLVAKLDGIINTIDALYSTWSYGEKRTMTNLYNTLFEVSKDE